MSPPSPRLTAAADLAPSELAALFTAAYAGYSFPVQMDAAALGLMVQSLDLDLARSVVAWDDQIPPIPPTPPFPIGLCLLALRGDRAWIGGMGVVQAARGRGLGHALMQAAIARARDAGARTVDLEVLETNPIARRTYERLGFTPTRDLLTWFVPAAPEVEGSGPTHG